MSSDGVVHQVAGGEVVGAVDDDVVAVDDVEDVVRPEPDVVGDDVDVGVESRQGLLGRVHLPLAQPVHVVEDLALEVGGVDDVHVDDPDRPHPGGRQVERGGRPESAGAEEQGLRVEELQLPLDADLGQEQMALVAVALLGGEGPRRLPGPALVLPAVEAADEGDHVGVAHVAQGLGREGRARPGGAVDDDGRRLVGDPALHLELEEAPGHVDGARQGPLLVLVRLPDVEEDGLAQPRLDLVGLRPPEWLTWLRSEAPVWWPPDHDLFSWPSPSNL